MSNEIIVAPIWTKTTVPPKTDTQQAQNNISENYQGQNEDSEKKREKFNVELKEKVGQQFPLEDITSLDVLRADSEKKIVSGGATITTCCNIIDPKAEKQSSQAIKFEQNILKSDNLEDIEDTEADVVKTEDDETFYTSSNTNNKTLNKENHSISKNNEKLSSSSFNSNKNRNYNDDVISSRKCDVSMHPVQTLPPIPDLIPIRKSNLSQMAAAVVAKTIFKASLMNSRNVQGMESGNVENSNRENADEFSISLPNNIISLGMEKSDSIVYPTPNSTSVSESHDVITVDTDNDSEFSETKSVIVVEDAKKTIQSDILSNQDYLSNESSSFLFSFSSPLLYNSNESNEVNSSRHLLESMNDIEHTRDYQICSKEKYQFNNTELTYDIQTNSNTVDNDSIQKTDVESNISELDDKKTVCGNCENITCICEVKKNCSGDEKICSDYVEDTEISKIHSPPEVTHRKSYRRRVAPDIYFVFEEHPANKHRNRKSKRPRGRPRTKTLKGATPRLVSKTLSQQNQPQVKTESGEHSENGNSLQILSTSNRTMNCSECSTPKQDGENTLQIKTLSLSQVEQSTENCKIIQEKHNENEIIIAKDISTENNESLIPRVNPIFLWVKKDDTRIVEVRCEDYDKRNRIRLTKTASGWRAIPRTDPTSSRVVKLLPNPMVHVKHEPNTSKVLSNHCQIQNQIVQIPLCEHKITLNMDSNKSQADDIYLRHLEETKTTTEKSNKRKKKKKKHKKRRNQKENEKELEHEEEEIKPIEHDVKSELSCDNISLLTNKMEENENEQSDVRKLLSPVPTDIIIYENSNQEKDDDEKSTKTKMEEKCDETDTLVQSDEHHTEQLNINSIEIPQTITQMTQDIELSIPFIEQLQNNTNMREPSLMSLCSDGGIFTSQQTIANGMNTCLTDMVSNSDDGNLHSDIELDNGFNENNLCQDDAKHLKELLEDEELLQHCENAIAGSELIDSLVKKGCEDNHISNSNNQINDHTNTKDLSQMHSSLTHHHNHIKSHICLGSEFDHEDEDLLLDQEPVEDIISRLGESLASSPKCLSFNEAGEIEALNGELFQTSNHSSDNFEQRTTFDELSMSIKDLETPTEINGTMSQIENDHKTKQRLIARKAQMNPHEEDNYTTKVDSDVFSDQTSKQQNPISRVSPDSSADELPKDLTCKKGDSAVKLYEAGLKPDRIASELLKDLIQTSEKNFNNLEQKSLSEPIHRPSSISFSTSRTHSRCSDTIQSPQPSGLPAVPSSPDLVHCRNKTLYLDHLLANISNSQTFPSKTISNQSISCQQKEPLDLGKHRKSASPTVSCSEEAKLISQLKQPLNTAKVDIDIDEPLQKKIKKEIFPDKTQEQLLEMTFGKDPDPLTQLRLLISNTEWKVPDPIVVPKDRLNAVLASPAREIPLLLTTRPELRLPEAFAYPQILQDPDILVISIAQLEKILQKQSKPSRPTNTPKIVPHVTIEAIPKPRDSSKRPTAGSQPTQRHFDMQQNLTSIDLTSPSPKITSSSSSTPKSIDLQSSHSTIGSSLASEIDSANLAAFSQMLWLPYFGQMNPEILKSVAGLPNGRSLVDILPLFAQQKALEHQNQSRQHPVSNTIPMQSTLEIAMWQEALNQAKYQRAIKLNAAATAAAVANSRESQSTRKQNLLQAKTLSDVSSNAEKRNEFKQYNTNAKMINDLFAQKRGFMSAGIFDDPDINYSQWNQQQCPSQQQHYNKSTSSVSAGNHPFDMENCKRASAKQPYMTTNKSISNDRLQRFHILSDNPGSSPSVSRKSKTQHNVQHQQAQIHQNKNNSQLHLPTQSKQQFNDQHSIEQKPRLTCRSLMNLLQPERLIRSGSEAKFTNLMTMPVFDQTACLNQQQLQNSSHKQFPMSQHYLSNLYPRQLMQNTSKNAFFDNFNINQNIANSSKQPDACENTQTESQHPGKLKVKPGLHLLDPAAVPKRLICDDFSEVGSTTHGLEDIINDASGTLWHPLFGSAHKSGYSSPWQWTTVTATGE